MNDADHVQLVDLFDRMCRAWTEAFDGARTQGQRQVIESHDKLFRGVLFGSALVGEIESVRPLGPDVALLYGTGSVVVAWRSRPPRRRLTRNTLVAVRESDGWRITAIHNGRVRPVAVPEVESSPSRAARSLVRVTGALGLNPDSTQPGRGSAYGASRRCPRAAVPRGGS